MKECYFISEIDWNGVQGYEIGSQCIFKQNSILCLEFMHKQICSVYFPLTLPHHIRSYESQEEKILIKIIVLFASAHDAVISMHTQFHHFKPD